jgi:hypothetical protein
MPHARDIEAHALRDCARVNWFSGLTTDVIGRYKTTVSQDQNTHEIQSNIRLSTAAILHLRAIADICIAVHSVCTWVLERSHTEAPNVSDAKAKTSSAENTRRF